MSKKKESFLARWENGSTGCRITEKNGVGVGYADCSFYAKEIVKKHNEEISKAIKLIEAKDAEIDRLRRMLAQVKEPQK